MIICNNVINNSNIINFIITKQIIDNCFTIINMAHQMLQSAVIIYIIIVNVIGIKNAIEF